MQQYIEKDRDDENNFVFLTKYDDLKMIGT